MKTYGATVMKTLDHRPDDAATFRPKTTEASVVKIQPEEAAAAQSPCNQATSNGPRNTSPLNASQPIVPISTRPPKRLSHSAYWALKLLPAKPTCSTPASRIASASAGGAATSLKPEYVPGPNSEALTACSRRPNTTPAGSEYHTMRVQNACSTLPHSLPACRRAAARASVHVTSAASAPAPAATASGHVPTNPSQLAAETPMASSGKPIR